jgi:hypothetical protein
MSDIIKHAEKNGEFVMLEDGFWYYWPVDRGAISEYDLYCLYQELVKRNEKWNEEVNEYFRNQQQSEAGSGMDGRQACSEDDFGNSPTSVDRTPDT